MPQGEDVKFSRRFLVKQSFNLLDILTRLHPDGLLQQGVEQMHSLLACRAGVQQCLAQLNRKLQVTLRKFGAEL